MEMDVPFDEVEFDKTVGKNIRERMKTLGISIKELADMAGISEKSLSRYLKGERGMPVYIFATIMSCLDNATP